MIITIDTDKDSPEHMRRTAALLLDLAGAADTSMHGEAGKPDEPSLDAGVLGLFDADDEPKKSNTPGNVIPYD